MRIGIVSDLHNKLPESVKRAFLDCDRILCAGDTENQRILWELEAIAPVTAVLRNCDASTILHETLPFSVSPLLEGVRFLMVHRPQDIGVPAPDVRVVVHGHTHVPRNVMVGDVRYVNPGSPTYPRGGSNPSCAVMIVDAGSVKDLRFIDLASPAL